MSRHITLAIRSLALASATLAAATACRNDGPIGPQSLPGPRAPGGAAAMVRPKPTLYFNGILFQGSQDQASGEIYSVNPDGSALFRLTNDDVADGYPDVSPNGPAFIWARYGASGRSSEIFSQNLDGTKRKQLTSLGTLVLYPRYSPDGTRIAFSAVTGAGGGEIYTMNADGSAVGRLTFMGHNAQAPTWSPDGSKIAFQSGDNAGVPGVWVMNASGSGQMLLATCPSPGCGRPKWSPVANEIAVEHLDGSGIIVIDAATGLKTGYVPSIVGVADMTPTWSKDGLRVVFASQRSGNGTYDLYSSEPVRGGDTMPPPATRLTTLGGNELFPAYSH